MIDVVRRVGVLLAGVLLAAAGLGSGAASAAEGPGVITEFPVPTADSHLYGIAAGPDGNMWFTEWSGNNIGRITPAGVITEFPVPTAGSRLYGIAAGPDGNMWFTEYGGNQIGRITPAGVITEFPMPMPGATPYGIAAGPDGNMWFTEYGANKIGRITPAGAVTEYVVPTLASNPRGIAAGPDGNMWFTGNNKVGRITPAGVITEFPVAFGSSSDGIAAGPDGNIWFSGRNTNKVGRITPAGVVTDFPVPTPASGTNALASIALGPDGNLWFTEWSGNKIGRITSGVYRRPALAGTGQVGLPLVCGADVWGPTAVVSVAWQRDGAAIGGQTELAYTPTAAELGSQITCTSSSRLTALLTDLTATSNPVTVVPQLTGPPGQDGVVTLAAVWAPGKHTANAGKTLKVQFGVTNAVALQAQLKGKKKRLTKQVNAKAGTNTLKWKLPKSLKAGKYSLKLLYQGAAKATTKVKVTR